MFIENASYGEAVYRDSHDPSIVFSPIYQKVPLTGSMTFYTPFPIVYKEGYVDQLVDDLTAATLFIDNDMAQPGLYRLPGSIGDTEEPAYVIQLDGSETDRMPRAATYKIRKDFNVESREVFTGFDHEVDTGDITQLYQGNEYYLKDVWFPVNFDNLHDNVDEDNPDLFHRLRIPKKLPFKVLQTGFFKQREVQNGPEGALASGPEHTYFQPAPLKFVDVFADELEEGGYKKEVDGIAAVDYGTGLENFAGLMEYLKRPENYWQGGVLKETWLTTHHSERRYYYFDKYGSMVANNTVDDRDDMGFFREDGFLETGWLEKDGKYYYQAAPDSVNSEDIFVEVDRENNVIKNFPKNRPSFEFVPHEPKAGVQRGWTKIDGGWYFFHRDFAYALTGHQNLSFDYVDKDNRISYATNDYVLHFNGQPYSPGIYEFKDGLGKAAADAPSGYYYIGTEDPEGMPAYIHKNYHYTDPATGNEYYFDGNGKAVTGLVTLEGKGVCFLGADGVRRYGVQELDGKTYYTDEAGKAISGEVEYGGKKVPVRGNHVLVGLVQEDGGIVFYSEEDYTRVTGLVEFNGGRYFFGSDGFLVTDGPCGPGDKYFAKNGRLVAGWAELDGYMNFYSSEDNTLQLEVAMRIKTDEPSEVITSPDGVSASRKMTAEELLKYQDMLKKEEAGEE